MPCAMVKLGQLPGGLEDRRVTLPLPVFDIKRTIRVPESAETLHDEIGSRLTTRRSLLVSLPLFCSHILCSLTSPGTRRCRSILPKRTSCQPSLIAKSFRDKDPNTPHLAAAITLAHRAWSLAARR